MIRASQVARVAQVVTRLRWPKSLAKRVLGLCQHGHLDVQRSWGGGDLRRFIAQVGPENVEELLAFHQALASSIATASATAAGEGEREGEREKVNALHALHARLRKELAKNPPLRREDLAVSGRDLERELGIPPGPAIGRVLSFLLKEVWERPENNRQDLLLQIVRENRKHQKQGQKD